MTSRTNRSSASRGRGGRGASTTWRDRLPAWLPAPRVAMVCRTVAWMAVVVGLGWGVAAGVPELERRASAREFERTSSVDVVFTDEPSWFRSDPDLVPQLVGTVQAAIGCDRAFTADRAGLVSAIDALRASGWFEAVHQVRWSRAGQVVVEADWVVPAVVVRAYLDGGLRDVLVDRRGRRLPYSFDPGQARSLPRLIAPALERAPAVGEAWGDDVEAGIALHDLLGDHPWYDQVRSIDLEGFRDRDGLVIRTDDCSIVWGLAPGANSLAEPPASDKLRYLDALVAQYGRIDTHCLGGRISLPADVVTYRAAAGR